MDKRKRLYIIAGHYGSGKTNIAVNLALKLKGEGLNTKIVDLDIVNPYFRTKDSAEALEKAGIELISPAFANTNVDLPALPKEVYGVIQARDCYGVIDVGGDDRGAYALGRYAPSILEENNFEMCFVANFYRPLTKTAQEALEVMREIEEACKIKFTAIINNSNLGGETTEETVINTLEKVKELCELSGLPLLFNAVEKGIKNVPDSFYLELQEKYYDIKE